MKLIAESGSTKTDWVGLADNGEQQYFSSVGLNPFFCSSQQVEKTVAEITDWTDYNIDEVIFYGAGCSSTERKHIIEAGLTSVFPNANIAVKHDLEASVRATCGNDKGVCCILGTGSNSVYFNGVDMIEKVPSLGYVLGDEGSGGNLGKELLKMYLYKKLDADLNQAFETTYSLGKDEILNAVYKEPNPNVYLASFAKFVYAHKDHLQMRGLVTSCFQEFVDIHVKCFSNYQDVPVHFVGSISHYFKDELKVVLSANDISIGCVVQKPFKNLVDYHLNQ